MDELTSILQQNDVDTSTFAPVVELPGFTLRAFAAHGDEAINLWFHLRSILKNTPNNASCEAECQP